MSTKKIVLIALLFVYVLGFSQENPKEFTLNEFLAIVKKHHPLVKSANLQIDAAQAKLLTARGAFDPKIEVDFDKKVFKDKEYYSLLNGSFKVPTWYGIELKGAIEQNTGYYINPQNLVPEQGLTSIGINIPLLQGLLINQRMADLQKAKIQVNLSDNQRKFEAIQVLYLATLAYCNWKTNYDQNQLYTQYFSNATLRYQAVQKLIEQGDKAAIDSVEANISLQNRKLNLEESSLKLTKARIELSNFLWIDDVPLEVQETLLPEQNLLITLPKVLQTNLDMTADLNLQSHPKIRAINQKIEMLTLDKKLAKNQLLPKIDLEYALLTNTNNWSDPNYKDYKIGLNFYFLLFLRKERGYAKLAHVKLQNEKLNLNYEKLQLENKFKSQKAELLSLEKQNQMASQLVKDTNRLLLAEERLFQMGESSLFLINTRENTSITTAINKINLENKYYIAFAELYKLKAEP